MSKYPYETGPKWTRGIVTSICRKKQARALFLFLPCFFFHNDQQNLFLIRNCGLILVLISIPQVDFGAVSYGYFNILPIFSTSSASQYINMVNAINSGISRLRSWTTTIRSSNNSKKFKHNLSNVHWFYFFKDQIKNEDLWTKIDRNGVWIKISNILKKS